MKKKFGTNYRVATQWCNNSYVLCNNIVAIDPSVINNARFSFWYDEAETEYREIYQWFISDACETSNEFAKHELGEGK